jgi:hypothetical protein
MPTYQKTTTSSSHGFSHTPSQYILTIGQFLIKQFMDKTMLNTNISVLNAETPLISNGIVPFTNVEPVIKWRQDTHLKLVEEECTTMESADITTSKVNSTEILPESVKTPPIVCTYLSSKLFKT